MANEQRVVVVGSGPAGLAAALELGTRGIACTIIERETRAGYAPRAKTTHTRTREHLRRWGIADKLAAASPFGVDYPSHVLFVTKLAGKFIHRFENALQCSPERDERYSEHGQWIPQYKLEGVLREHALTLPGFEIRYGLEFLGYEDTGQGLTISVRDVTSGAIETIAAAYLIGADGARSAVREAIGAQLVGTYGLSRNYNTIFRAPGLAEAHDHGPGVMYWQINGDVPSVVGPMDVDDLWYFMPTGLAPDVTYTDEQAVDAIKCATGIDLPYEILSSDVWIASRFLADFYRKGRVFLSGDACHLHPPFGGFGMNMGVADSVDLGWKIAAVMQGWGGEALLDSYQIERRGAHEYVLDESVANHAALPTTLYREGVEDDTAEGAAIRREVSAMVVASKTAEFYALGVVLGYCYRDSPVIVDDGTAARWTRSRDYVPSATPGCLAPHHWLDDGRSLYDLFGAGFTLLVLREGRDQDVALATAEAKATGTPLTVVRIDDAAVQALYEAPLVLIRPDQHLVWRGDRWPAASLLEHVTGRLPAQAPTAAERQAANSDA